LPGVHFFGRGTTTMFGTQGLTATGGVFAACGIPAAAEDGAETWLLFSNASTASSWKNFNHDRSSGGFDRMTSAAVNVLLAVGVSVCVFLVAWWLVGKL
jgi:hypothetical protein